MRRLLFLLLPLLALPLTAATRLPTNVIPSHYDLVIYPDLATEKFSGSVVIDVDVKAPTDTITLHSVGLALRDVFVDAQLSIVTYDAPNEIAMLKVAQPLAVGPAHINVKFDGTIAPGLRGLYLSRTAKRKYAVTQFEATSARRAFPCFDEPALKATFDITLVVDKGDTAISNGAIVSDTPAGDKHALKFAQSKKLPTYLVALLIGDFECIKGSANDVPIRVCSTPGLQHLGTFALGAAEASIKYFEEYYGIKYPFGKLDMIGIPDFGAGAMENAAAITYRETDLLIDEKTASTIVRKRVAEVVAHEIAHQWFGDLVTMKWWDDIWLNEGFATLMSEKPVEAWKPEWHGALDRPLRTDNALITDSQRTTRAIRMPVTSLSENALFDSGITYDKTASVLRMTEEWLGRDAFRDAIRAYLKKYSYSNAAAEDFWSTMRTATKQPIDEVLRSFIDLTGPPLLRVSESCATDARTVTIAQQRLLPRGDAPPPQTWTIPICAHEVGVKTSQPCRLIAKESETLTFASPSCTRPLFLSRNGAGYYVVDYAPNMRNALRAHLGELPAVEEIAYHGNEWILVRSLHREAGEYLGLIRALPRPAERPLVTAVSDNIVYLDQRLVDDGNRAAWQAWVRNAVRGLAPATWDTPPNETGEQRIARATVLWVLGYVAGDREVLDGARKVAEQYMQNPSSVDAVVADRALRLSAINGDAAFFDRVMEQLHRAPTPELAARYRNLTPLFRDPQQFARAVDYIFSDEVRAQDVGTLIGAMFTDRATRAAAWTATKSRWSKLEDRGIAGRVGFSLGTFCDSESKKDVETFFAEHGAKMNQRTLSRAQETIGACIAFKAAQQSSFDKALSAPSP
jgi:aminopeptidase N/puromycin-sensitive aminopeptidase